MIRSPLFALGLTGRSRTSPIWYVESGDSNHINSSAHLTNIQLYNGHLKIHTADGRRLPLEAIGDILIHYLKSCILYIAFVF